jgi:predicted secreted Zn-dependent protease
MGIINTKKLYFIPLFLLVCSPVLAEPTIATKYNFYSIYPQKKQDLEREMTERSPIIFKGKKFKGYTKWYVEWRIRWLENQGSCKITQVKTALTVTYTLPKIPKDYKTPGETRTIFNNFYAALFKHEQNHRDSGLYAARDIEQALLNLGSFPNCKKLELTANQKGHQILQQYVQRDIDYDKRTDHGRLEGVMINNFLK